MFRHNVHRPPTRVSPGQKLESLEVKNIYAGIVEIEQAADLLMTREIPVIALCDSEGQTNWVSQKFVDDLAKSDPTAFKLAVRPRRRKGDLSHINIRWTCRKLGQFSQTGIFYIEPKANFKILFGCGYNINTDLRKRILYLPSPYNRIREKKQRHEDVVLSDKVAGQFRRGIEDGTLLQLRRIPQFPDHDSSFMTMAELEAELEYVYGSFSMTDEALNSTSTDEIDPAYPLSTMNLLEIESSQGSIVTDSEDPSSTASTNTSMSEEPYRSQSLSERLRRERCQPRQPWGLEGWFDQGICEEPQPWIRRAVQQRRAPSSFTRCQDVDPSQEQALAAARAEAAKRSAEYWIWDEGAKNYKHYDPGSAEPVWYNPP